MIKDLLPRYYEAHKNSVVYGVGLIQSSIINGHEVAWMEYRGITINGQPFVGRAIHCECDFTEGVGWEVNPKYGVVSIHRSKGCRPRRKFIYRRRAELNKEFSARFGEPLCEHLPEMIFALIEKVKAGEFLEDGNGAEFWGGYFYIHTVSDIVEISASQSIGPEIWRIVDRMVAEKKIGLEGAVITDYRKPPPARWDESFRVEKNGWVGIARFPAHRHMKKSWKFKILKPDGKTFKHSIPELLVVHPIDFGPDIEDINRAKEELNKFLEQVPDKS